LFRQTYSWGMAIMQYSGMAHFGLKSNNNSTIKQALDNMLSAWQAII
jgi:hypothetical protein